MKLLLLILLMYNADAYLLAERTDINQVRALYRKSATSEKACRELATLLSGADERDALLLGYKASNTMMLAKYALNPFSKLTYFRKGKEMLERALTLDKNNIELRFLRFVNQANAPSILGYKDHIEADKQFILEHLPKLKGNGTRDFMVRILQESKYLSVEEKKQIQ